MSCSVPFFVTNYFNLMDAHPEEFCKEQWAMRSLVEKSFENDDIYVEEERARKYFSLVKYFPYDRLYEWEEFVLGLHLCVYWTKDNTPRWSDAFCELGRGAGKDGVISVESMALVSPYNPVPNYDVDICANNQEQSVRPLLDVVDVLESPGKEKKLNKFFYHTKEIVKGRKNKGRIKGHTNNPKGRDGLRSGCVILNEVHQYENLENVNVFTTGLGKKDDPRKSIYTTDGDVVEGYLDDLKNKSHEILFNGAEDNGFLPFICKLDEKKEVHNEILWRKANPSLRYRPALLHEIRKEYVEWKEDPAKHTAFMTKRMNLRDLATETCVAKWDDIKKTNQEMPNLKGMECSVGIDYSKTNDWMSVTAHFKGLDNRYDINHSWFCTQSYDYPKYKDRIPLTEWEKKGYITRVDEPEISPDLIVEYIQELMGKYRIKAIAIDSYRFYLLENRLEKIGFSVAEKNVKLVRPSDIMKIYPVINRCFLNGYFVWGEQPVLRWATNNAKLVPVKKSVLTSSGESDTGNYLFGKIERRTRKTDPFMSMVHAMTLEDKLDEVYEGEGNPQPFNFGVVTY